MQPFLLFLNVREIITLLLVTVVGCQRPLPTREQVMVTFKNKSGQEIEQIILVHEGGIAKKNAIGPGDKATILFYSPGENALQTTIEFADGKTLRGRGTYTEGGYCLIQTIYTDSVVTEYDF